MHIRCCHGLLSLMIATALASSGGSSVAAAPSASEAGDPPRIVFLVNAEPDNYEADRTIPRFAQALHEARGYDCRVLEGQLPFERLRFPGLESLEQADLLVIFFRRSALAREQLDLIRRHLAAGKPLVGIRTANHAFSVRSEPAPGHEAWWEFVPEVLGCENRGYGKTEDGVDVTVATGQADHPILEGVTPLPWHSEGPLYRVAPLLDARATVLLLGSGGPAAGEPVAWTRMAGASRVFYTSLGYPSDFDLPQYRRLLENGIDWTLDRPRTPRAR